MTYVGYCSNFQKVGKQSKEKIRQFPDSFFELNFNSNTANTIFFWCSYQAAFLEKLWRFHPRECYTGSENFPSIQLHSETTSASGRKARRSDWWKLEKCLKNVQKCTALHGLNHRQFNYLTETCYECNWIHITSWFKHTRRPRGELTL